MQSPLREIQNTPRRDEEVERAKFNKLVVKAKELATQGFISKSLDLYRSASKIHDSEKIKKRIQKLQDYLKQYGEASEDEEEGDDMVHMGGGYYLYKELHAKLYTHQREGVMWMWGLYQRKKGGILGDDMGLGKTIQVIAFLSGMFDADRIKTVLIILPVAVIVNWEKEFENWAPGIAIHCFHGCSKRERERALNKVHRRSGVILTSYGMLVNNAATLAENGGKKVTWDYVILDEGHKIKNPSNKCSKGIHSIPARNRIILTGTPIQNNLKEMWSLFDYCHQGTLLGTAKTFSMEFENPITRARQKDSTPGECRLGNEMAASLKKMISPYFLRRTKAEVCKTDSSAKDNAPAMPKFTRKNDLVCWVFLSETQQRIYEEFINTDEVKDLLNSSRSPLTALMVLKKLCDHPRLLKNRHCISLGIHLDDEIAQQQENLDDQLSEECAAARINLIPDRVLIEESGKMVFLAQLLDNLKNEGHRCLVFSQSLKVLNIIQKVMTARGHKIARLDGTIKHTFEREQVITKFQNDRSYSLFLLTTQVGGVGLTLTAADRVVIYDPSWNPATDAQAVDRAFRIGQKENVVVYRLITCGSVEEKIYRRQIFKDSITKLTTGDSKNPYKYFTRQDLHELFVLDNPRYSNTQIQLQQLHEGQRRTDPSLDDHLAFLYTLDMFGLSDHDLMFSSDHVQEETTGDEDYDAGNDYIASRVQKAHQLISLESEENQQLTNQLGQYPAPEVNKAPRPARPPAETQSQPIPEYQEPVVQRPVISQPPPRTNKHFIETALEASVRALSMDNEETSETNESINSPRSPTPPRGFKPPSEPVIIDDSYSESPVKQAPRIPNREQGHQIPQNERGGHSAGRNEKGLNESGAIKIVDESFDKSDISMTKEMEDMMGDIDKDMNDLEGDFVQNDSDSGTLKGEFKQENTKTNYSDTKYNSPYQPNDTKRISHNEENQTSDDIPMATEIQDMMNMDKDLQGLMDDLPDFKRKLVTDSPAKSAKKKKRQSVCIPKTPRKTPDTSIHHSPEPTVVREELDFSPQVRLFDNRPERVTEDDEEEMEEDVANDEEARVSDSDSSDYASTHEENADTPVAKAKRKNRQAVIESDDDEENISNTSRESNQISAVNESENSAVNEPETSAVNEADISAVNEADISAVDESMQSDIGDSNSDRVGLQNETVHSSTRYEINESPVKRNNDQGDDNADNSETGGTPMSVDGPNESDIVSESIESDQVVDGHEKSVVNESSLIEENNIVESEHVGESSNMSVANNSVETGKSEIGISDTMTSENSEIGTENASDLVDDAASCEENEDMESEEESEEEEELTEEEIEKYNQLIKHSRELYKTGELKKALKFALLALNIYSGDEKAQKYALKLRTKVQEAMQSQ